MKSETKTSYRIASWVFLRALGLIYLLAFISLWPQIIGLVGHEGILPVGELLKAAAQHLGRSVYWTLPTLCWFNSSDLFLHILCGVGVLASLLLLCDVAPAAMLASLWAVYLSLTTVCQDFLSFQWDNLLMEAGFLAIFLAPFRWKPQPQRDPPTTLAHWLLLWLLFRLMFASGMVKLASGDVAWRSLQALTYHYETQPLPTWIGWYAHQLPVYFHRFACVVVFFVELIVPFFIFGPKPIKRLAAAILILFQLLIAATGNYTFFNLLTAALCLLLLDDGVWPTGPRRYLDPMPLSENRVSFARGWPRAVTGVLAALILVVSFVKMANPLGLSRVLPAPIEAIERAVAPLRSINGYGLFAVMTTRRSEIEIEGSYDGKEWKAYTFRHKPGPLERGPGFIAPHQPRLDWQMWFAALSDTAQDRWFLRFCAQLLRGSEPVLALLEDNPFAEQPPRYVRALAYEYRFTDLATRKKEGTWWERVYKGPYCPVLSLSP